MAVIDGRGGRTIVPGVAVSSFPSIVRTSELSSTITRSVKGRRVLSELLDGVEGEQRQIANHKLYNVK
jgi:hypothetical protein